MEHAPDPPSLEGSLINKIFMHFRILPIGDALLLKLAVLGVLVFGLWSLISFSSSSQVEVSSPGGSLTEGIVGTPRFVNPVLAVTRADKDMSILVYDGLMKLSDDGSLIPNIAESITLSDDGLIYNIILREDIQFHDQTPLTSNDVIFTVGRIQDPALASPLRSSFDGVVVEQITEHEINFILPEAYAPFIENLTFGILPRHVWKDATNEEFPFSQHNSEPIGSGPYKIKKIVRNTSGIPESYILEPHTSYHLGVPKIAEVTLNFYTNEEKALAAFSEGDIDSLVGISESNISTLDINPDTHTIITVPLPRTFAIFFNQNKSAALRDLGARSALNTAINKNELVNTVLQGYGNPLSSPIPPGFGVMVEEDTSTSTEGSFDDARAILRDSGWKLSDETGIWEKEIDEITTPLAFSIATVNNSTFENTAEYLRSAWEKLGASVSIKQFEQSDLTQAIIRPRDYEALLFGTAVGRSLDFYSFWHSSQRNDPGLNVSLYANITTDSILSEARTNSDTSEREAALLRFIKEIHIEVPAVFLYSPELIYIFPKHIAGSNFSGLEEPSERFASIRGWSINTETVWPLFKKTSTSN